MFDTANSDMMSCVPAQPPRDDVFHYVEQQWEEPDEYADAEQEDYYY